MIAQYGSLYDCTEHGTVDPVKACHHFAQQGTPYDCIIILYGTVYGTVGRSMDHIEQYDTSYQTICIVWYTLCGLVEQRGRALHGSIWYGKMVLYIWYGNVA